MGSKYSQKQDDYTPFQENGKYKKGFAEENSGEILVIENDSYSIRELLDKFTTGVLRPGDVQLSNMEELEYTDDMMDSTVPELVDRVDVQEYLQDLKIRKTLRDKALRKAAEKKESKANDDVETK